MGAWDGLISDKATHSIEARFLCNEKMIKMGRGREDRIRC